MRDKGGRPIWEKIFLNVVNGSFQEKSSDIVPVKNGSVWAPKVNGKHNKHMQQANLNTEGELISERNGLAKILQANVPMYKEVLPGLESWLVNKIASWHNLEGNSVQWFCVVCIDRRGKQKLL